MNNKTRRERDGEWGGATDRVRRHRERERERDRQTDRQTDRHRERQTERTQTEAEREKEKIGFYPPVTRFSCA